MLSQITWSGKLPPPRANTLVNSKWNTAHLRTQPKRSLKSGKLPTNPLHKTPIENQSEKRDRMGTSFCIWNCFCLSLTYISASATFCLLFFLFENPVKYSLSSWKCFHIRLRMLNPSSQLQHLHGNFLFLNQSISASAIGSFPGKEVRRKSQCSRKIRFKVIVATLR
jgi:hypothetical protein